MKVFTLIATLLTFQAYGLTLAINLPCDDKHLAFEVESDSSRSAGDITLQALLENNIHFLGTSKGINSILSTPTGLEALDVISDTEMFAYGWCYSINGHEPDKFPDEVFVDQTDYILWWFGFAHYKNGQWISQCEYSATRRLSTFCKN